MRRLIISLIVLGPFRPVSAAQPPEIGFTIEEGVWSDGENVECPVFDNFQDAFELSAGRFEEDPDRDVQVFDDPMVEWAPAYLRLPAGCLSLGPGIWMPVQDFKKLRLDRADLQERVVARSSGMSKEAEERIETAETWMWVLGAAGVLVGVLTGFCADGDCRDEL